MQLAIFGTFDVENYGDLLFPLIAEAELSERLGPIQLHRFSYHRKTADEWPYPVISLTELPEVIHYLDGLVIGGGHILRFDKSVAPNYFPPSPSIHHPTGYWLTPILLGLQAGLPVAWNAPGVHGDIPEWASPLMELALSGSRYVSVRDEPSRQALAPFAPSSAEEAEIHVVPDSAFGIARLLKSQEPSPDFVRLRERLNLRSPYLILHAIQVFAGLARFIRDHPQMYRDYQIVVLHPSPVFAEKDPTLDCDLPGVVRLPTWPHPLLLAELVRGAAAVISVSLHLSITALAFGIPVFRRAGSFNGKYAVLSNYGGVYTFNDEDGLDPHLLKDRPVSSPEVAAAIAQLARHWDGIAELFLSARTTPKVTPLVIKRFWQELPRMLDAQALAVDTTSNDKRSIAAALHKIFQRLW